MSWDYISSYQILSRDFIREFKDLVNWGYIFSNQKLSEDFIREFKDKVDWDYISEYQKLSEDFIREFKDYLNWDYISQYQTLSESFIREFSDKINFFCASFRQIFSEEFKKEFEHKVSPNNWGFILNEKKMQTIKESGLYEIDGDYIFAYKSTKKDGYSVYDFSYKYEVGKIYESKCDCDICNGYSYGLSAWRKNRIPGIY